MWHLQNTFIYLTCAIRNVNPLKQIWAQSAYTVNPSTHSHPAAMKSPHLGVSYRIIVELLIGTCHWQCILQDLQAVFGSAWWLHSFEVFCCLSTCYRQNRKMSFMNRKSPCSWHTSMPSLILISIWLSNAICFANECPDLWPVIWFVDIVLGY